MGDAATAISEEEFVKRYLGLEPRDILRSSNLLNNSAWGEFWSEVRTKIETSDLLNPRSGDSESTKKEKAELKARAYDFMLSWFAIASDRRSKNTDDSEFIRTAKGYVSQFQKVEEAIVDNEIVRIGQTLFGPENLDPTDIRISEAHSVHRLGTLRSDTDAAVKLPRSFTQVTVDLVFSGPAQINQRLRPLLAELLATPVTTMESTFLTAAVVNHYAMPEVEAEIKRRVYSASGQSTLQGFDTQLAQANESFERLRELFTNDDLLLEYFRQRELDRARQTGPVAASISIENEGKAPPIGVSVPVCFQDIVVTTDPTSPNTLHVRLAFILFNSRAFGAYGIEYKDNDGNRTTDIMRCGILRRYVEWAFLKDRPDGGPPILGEYNAHQLQDTPDFACRWRDIVDPDLVRDFPKDNDHFVVNSVQASLGIKSVPIPLIGSKFPTVQVLGRASVQARIVLQTTSTSVVRQFALMKDHVDAISRNVGGQYRDEFVDIKNSVLNLMGGRRFIITGVEFSPMEDTSNGYEISITLTQAEYSFKEQQSLIFKDETVPKDMLLEFWRHLVKKAKEAVTKSLLPDGSLPVADEEARLAHNLLFGTEKGGSSSGILNADILIAGVLRIYAKKYNLPISSQELILKIYEANYTKSPPGPMTADEQVGAEFLEVVGKAPIPSAIRVGPNAVFGKFVRGMISGDNALAGGGGYTAFTLLQTIMKAGGPNSDSANYIWFTDALWDAVLEAMTDIRGSAYEVENLAEKKLNSSAVYSVDKLTVAIGRLSSIFTDGSISKFSFDATKYLAKINNGNMTVMDQDSSAVAKRRTISNYPDIPLPTYEELFRDQFDTVISNQQDGSSTDLWTRFAPTYFDLGKIPPDGIDVRNSLKIARRKSDVMEPGFWFFHQRSREEQLRRAIHAIQKMEGQQIRNISDNRVQLNVGTEDLLKQDPAMRKDTFQELFWDAYRNDKTVQGRIDGARKKRTYIDIVDHNGCYLGVYRPKGPNAANGEFEVELKIARNTTIAALDGRVVYDPYSEDHNKSLTTRILQSVPDNTLSMTRVFPAFRIWFVEWDNNRGRAEGEKLSGRVVRLLDDLYSTNAIVSLHITDSKDDGAVAEVMVLNTVGTFDTDSFLLPNEAKRISQTQGTEEIGTDDEGEGFLRRMKLQTGTGIVIQMGYTSDINSLKTVFTGAITEIAPGKVIKFIAQGYKAELDQDVDILVQRDNAAEAVRELIQMGSAAKKNPTPHLGRVYDARELDETLKTQIFGSHALRQTGFLGLEGPGGAWASWFGRWANTSLRNVYVESTNGPATWLGQTWQDIREWQLFRWIGIGTRDAEWHFYSTTAWQGLQEMTRYMPGTVVAVRPYDNEGTVFFGRPDQPYEFRAPRALESNEWFGKIAGSRAISVAGLLQGLLTKFWGSKYGTTNQMLLNQNIEQAKRAGIVAKTNQPIGSPGWFAWLGEDRYYGGTAVANKRDKGTNTGTIVDQISPSYLGYLKWADIIGTHNDIAGFPEVLGDRAMELDQRFSEVVTTGWRNLAIYETLGLDFEPDWQRINQFHPELGKFIFYYFYRLPYYRPVQIQGDFNDLWRKFVDVGIGPLLGKNNEPTSRFHDWVRFTHGIEAKSNFDSVDHFVVNYDEVKDQTWDHMDQAIKDAIAQVDRDMREGKIDAPEAARRKAELEQILATVTSHGGVSTLADFGYPSNVSDTYKGNYTTDGKYLAQILFDYFPRFRLFVHYFAQWLQDTQARPDAGESFRQADVKQNLDSLQVTSLPPWMKQFRDYHLVFSNHDIVDNTIVASMEEMSNTWVIRHPGDSLPERSTIQSPTGQTSFIDAKEWKSYPESDGWPFHPDLKRSQRKLAVCLEPNANEKHRQASVLLTNACEGLRPMYRGEIKIIGRVVFPWDVVGILDEVNGMTGVVEVDRVTHEFTSETGWITTIVPHAYCHPMNPFGLWQLTTTFDWLGFVDTVLNVVTVVSTVLFVFRGLSVLGNVARNGLVEGFISRRMLVNNAGIAGEMVAGTNTTTALTVAGGLRKPLEAEVAAIAKEFAGKKLITKAFIDTEGAAVSRAAIGKFLAANWLPVLSRIGRKIGFWSIANEAIPPAASLLFGLSTKGRTHNLAMPIDLRVLMHKGMPLTAGLDLDDGHFEPFDSKLSGFFGEFMKTMNSWLYEVAPASTPIPTNMESPR